MADPVTMADDSQITSGQAATVQSFAVQSDDLLIWVITENPSDHPGKFIGRPASTRRGVSYRCYLEADTLESVRDALPVGLTRLPRDPSDDPVIVESWI